MTIKFNEIEHGLKEYGFSSAKTISKRHGYPLLDTVEYLKLMVQKGLLKHAKGARDVNLYGALEPYSGHINNWDGNIG